tara:strand:+ start:11777 stop:12253 length:477 start_codon:yes stop_codon:yes gene_type:complete
MKNSKDHAHKGNYGKFILILLASFMARYMVMYMNTYSLDHVYFSTTRFYMSCLGIAAMAVIMLLFMWKMYTNTKKNWAILFGSLFLFVSALYLVRSQKPIGDVLWMKAMIPHHSIAILTSNKADLQDPEVKKLAEEIIKAQEREIVRMKEMIKRLEKE